MIPADLIGKNVLRSVNKACLSQNPNHRPQGKIGGRMLCALKMDHVGSKRLEITEKPKEPEGPRSKTVENLKGRVSPRIGFELEANPGSQSDRMTAVSKRIRQVVTVLQRPCSWRRGDQQYPHGRARPEFSCPFVQKGRRVTSDPCAQRAVGGVTLRGRRIWSASFPQGNAEAADAEELQRYRGS